MTSRDFCFWLQGYFELSGDDDLSANQRSIIAKHLSLVFAHEIDPSMGPPAEQAKLDAVHGLPLDPEADKRVTDFITSATRGNAESPLNNPSKLKPSSAYGDGPHDKMIRC